MSNFIASIFMLLLIAIAGCNSQPDRPSHEAKRHATPKLPEPLSITLDNEGEFANGWSWTLTVGADRSASLEIRAFPDAQKRTFTLTLEPVSYTHLTLPTICSV